MQENVNEIYTDLFQSTLPREERPYEMSTIFIYRNFNPRSHERSDLSVTAEKSSVKDFNPRSHERSDCKIFFSFIVDNHFNPRSHERSDGGHRIKMHPAAVISIHAPTRGATGDGCQEVQEVEKFQSTLPREERRTCRYYRH